MRMASSHTTPTGPTRLLAVLLIAPFMAQADATIANVAAPSIHADLHTTGAELELVIGAYLIAFAVLLITGARLGQLHGYRRMFLLGVGLFTGASLLCGLAPGPIALIAARALQGAGAALMFPQALTGIQLTFEGADRARAIGLYAVALSIGAVAGQVLGGVLVSADVLGQRVALDLLRQRARWAWPSSRPAPATSRARAQGSARHGASTSRASPRCRPRCCSWSCRSSSGAPRAGRRGPG